MTAYELESKLELDRTDFEQLLAYGSICGHTDQLNVYYDSNRSLFDYAATFRIRFFNKKRPIMTLKMPVSTDLGTRKSIEVEQALGIKSNRHKQWDVANDLPEEFATHLLRFGINRLDRIGWMRNRRWQVELIQGLVIELDRVTLPNGKTFFEVEIENSQLEMHTVALSIIKKVTKASRPSTLSKYERFLESLDKQCIS